MPGFVRLNDRKYEFYTGTGNLPAHMFVDEAEAGAVIEDLPHGVAKTCRVVPVEVDEVLKPAEEVKPRVYSPEVRLSEAVLKAVTSCPHTIESGSIELRYDERSTGKNALAQLANRISDVIEHGDHTVVPDKNVIIEGSIERMGTMSVSGETLTGVFVKTSPEAPKAILDAHMYMSVSIVTNHP